ncbi:MAG: hypothetical protein QOG46_661 [Pseudonocardiales bacterium]|nr:hypothetical protein [Pseudonocardiales bacterium]
MKINQSPGVSGPAPQESAPCPDSSEGDRILVSCSNPSTPPGARQVADLFQPVTSSAPPIAGITEQPVAPMNGLHQDGELLSAPAPQSGYARGAWRWANRGAGLVAGTPGAVVALVASAALVLVAGGMTMFTTSSSTELPVTGLAPARLPAPVMPAVSDEHPVTVAPIEAPAGFAQQAPTKANLPDPPPAPTHQQPLPAAHRALPAPNAPPSPPDHGPVLSPPRSSPSPSTVTTEDAGYWGIPTHSPAGKTESPTTNTEDCNCDGPQRKIPNHGDRQSEVDRQRELRAQGAEYRSTSKAQESRIREQAKQDRQAARPDAKPGHRPSPSRGS